MIRVVALCSFIALLLVIGVVVAVVMKGRRSRRGDSIKAAEEEVASKEFTEDDELNINDGSSAL